MFASDTKLQNMWLISNGLCPGLLAQTSLTKAIAGTVHHITPTEPGDLACSLPDDCFYQFSLVFVFMSVLTCIVPSNLPRILKTFGSTFK